MADGIDLGRAAGKILALVRKSAAPDAGMDALIAWCAASLPHRAWRKAGAIDWLADALRLERWLESLLRDEPPPPEADGLMFGLFNPVRKRRPTADLYACGNPFDAEESDWACDPAWFPDGRYAGSRALDAVYRIAYGEGAKGLGNNMEYPLVLGHAALAVLRLCRALPSDLLRGGAKRRHVATGFDSGDILQIGSIGPRGFVINARWG